MSDTGTSTHLRRPADVAAVAAEPLGEDDVARWYVARLPDGPLVVLEDTAALIWAEAADGPEDALALRVAARLAQGPAVAEVAADIATDVDAFVTGLVGQGLLERHTAYSTP